MNLKVNLVVHDTRMKIGELAKLSGLTASRIRFYEASGLITAVERRANGYRDYPPATVGVLEIIAAAQGAGFSLDQLRSLVPQGSGSWNHDELREALSQKITEIETLQKQLKQSRAKLLVALEGLDERPAGLSCEANAQRVLNRLRGRGVMSGGGAGRVKASPPPRRRR